MEEKLGPCPCCGRIQKDDGENKSGYVYKSVGDGWHHVSCPCGLMTRLFDNRTDLLICWNSRPDKILLRPVISVKHAGTRGMEPGTVASQEKKNLQKALSSSSIADVDPF